METPTREYEAAIELHERRLDAIASIQISRLNAVWPRASVRVSLPWRFHRPDDLLCQPVDGLLLRRGDRLTGLGDEIARLANGQ